jgi:hypothetical protein
VGLSISLSLLGNKSIKTFPRQRRISGGVFYDFIYASYMRNEIVQSPNVVLNKNRTRGNVQHVNHFIYEIN